MSGYLVKVKKQMNIHSAQRTRNILSGNHGSVFKGRSMDFDDLREYVYGDDIKDIDWKATARSDHAMVRRYIAIRKRNILLVCDNGQPMAALTPSGEVKGEVATFCAGVMAYIAQRDQDLVGMVYGNTTKVNRYAMREETAFIEEFLGRYRKSIEVDGPTSNIDALLSYISKNYRERLFIIVITDPTTGSNMNWDLIRHLSARNNQMYIFIEDSPITNNALLKYDMKEIDGRMRIPHFFRANHKLAVAETAYREAQKDAIRSKLHHYGIVNTFVDGTKSAIPQILKMLEEQKHVRR